MPISKQIASLQCRFRRRAPAAPEDERPACHDAGGEMPLLGISWLFQVGAELAEPTLVNFCLDPFQD